MHRILCRGRLLAAFAIAVGLIVCGRTAGRRYEAHGREGGAECRPDHSRQCRRQARHLQETRARPEDRRFQRRQQNGAGPGGRQHRYRRRRRHRDGAGRQGRADDRGLRDRRAGSVPQRRRAVRFAASQSIADLKGKKIGVSTAGSLTDWLTKELARKQGMGAARRHRGGDRQRRQHRSSRRSAATSSMPISPRRRCSSPWKRTRPAAFCPGHEILGQSRRRHALCVEQADRQQSRRGARVRRRLDRDGRLHARA